MKTIATFFFAIALAPATIAQVTNRSYTDCNNQTQDIYTILGSGKSILVASEGLDCSICMSKAPALQSWAANHKSQVQVWGAMTYTYSGNLAKCSGINNWETKYGWTDIFTFTDSSEFYFSQGTPRFTVYSPEDSTIVYQGFSESEAQDSALVASSKAPLSIDENSLENISVGVDNEDIHLFNLPNKTFQGQLLDVTGSVQKSFEVTTGEYTLSVTDLPSGIYILSLKSEGKQVSRKVIWP